MSRDVTFILPQDYGFNAATVLKGVPGVYDASVSGPLESGLPQVAITGYNTVGRGSVNTPQELYIRYKPAPYQKINQQTCHPAEVEIKGAKTRGRQISIKDVSSITSQPTRGWDPEAPTTKVAFA